MKNLLNAVKLTKPKKNVFDLTHDVKLSCNMGELVPVMCTEVVPGDTITIGCESLIRLAPLVAPMMHRLDVTMHYFFVPNRLVWSGWEDWITGKVGAGAFPTISYNDGGFPQYTALCDYLGIPTPINANVETISAIPFAAYQCIYNEYYRDQNLISEVDYQLVDGNQTSLNVNNNLWPLRKRAWEHDYFTSSLPFAQKGAAVEIPIGQIDSDVEVLVNDVVTSPYTQLSGVPNNVDVNSAPTGDVGSNLLYAATDGLSVTAGTINDLRNAYRLQEWLEKNARGGTRYVESILAHFGVKSSDARLQRPEYITGVKSPIVISEILNTTGTTELPQGNMAGHGVGVVSGGKYGSKFIEEHGYIIGIMSVMPKTAYQQGIPRHFLKVDDQFQYYWPEFAHIGEQEVYNNEIYAQQGASSLNTFGYVPRYAEYKFENNRVAGDFRSTLDHWHMGRIFASAPALNQAFIECVPTTRVFAVEDATDKLYCHVLNKVKAIRPMPKFGTPTF